MLNKILLVAGDEKRGLNTQVMHNSYYPDYFYIHTRG